MTLITKSHHPYWYQLLDFWVNQKYNSGLTLPFLIGAGYGYFDQPIPGERSIDFLIREVVESRGLPYSAGIKYCRTIRAYILTLVDRDEVESPFFANSDGTPSFAVINKAFGKKITLDWIIEFLIKEFSSTIIVSQFSKDASSPDGWGPFSASDIQQIEALIT